MLKKTITYKDFNGEDRTEDFYFNLTRTEVMAMEMSIEGGLVQLIEKIVAEKNGEKLIKLFQEVILKAYGEKSPDGKYFMKSDEISARFTWTNAYDQLFTELSTNADAAANFINAIVPSVEPAK